MKFQLFVIALSYVLSALKVEEDITALWSIFTFLKKSKLCCQKSIPVFQFSKMPLALQHPALVYISHILIAPCTCHTESKQSFCTAEG